MCISFIESAIPLTCLPALAMAAPLQEIYDGLWSYNAMLTCTVLGGMLYVISLRSHVLALFSGKHLHKLGTGHYEEEEGG